MTLHNFFIRFPLIMACTCSLIALFSSCSTGIESTKTIKLSRDDQKILKPEAEEILISEIKADSLAAWNPGKRFMITDDRASMVYEVYDRNRVRVHNDSLAGTIVEYLGRDRQSNPDGSNVGVISFIDRKSGKTLKYVSRRSFDRLGTLTWSDIPMILDLDILDNMRRLLKGRRVWSKTGLWYSETGEPVKGAKFIPVTITDIMPGNGVFPFTVTIDDGTRQAYLPMNSGTGNSGYETRSFPSLFSLDDPKKQYPQILPEIWTLICNGKVTQGMTKQECKLSLGNPRDVESGHDWNNLLDFWKYSDGTYLVFQDGILIRYK